MIAEQEIEPPYVDDDGDAVRTSDVYLIAAKGAEDRTNVQACERPTIPASGWGRAAADRRQRDRQGCSADLVLATEAHAPSPQMLDGLTRVPQLSVWGRSADLGGLGHRDAFILGLVDGTTSLDSIVAVSTLPPVQVLEVLVRLARDGLITLE